MVGLTSGVQQVTAGSHTCALTVGGGVKCWGYNYDGQLGNNTTVHSSVPVDVVGLTAGAGGAWLDAIASKQLLGCGADGTFGTTGEFFNNHWNALIAEIDGPFNHAHTKVSDLLGHGKYEALRREYTRRPDPMTQAAKTGAVALADAAIGAIPVVGTAWTIGRGLQETIYAYADALQPVDTSYPDELEGYADQVLAKLYPEIRITDQTGLYGEEFARGIAAGWLNKFAARFGRCPNIVAGGLSRLDRRIQWGMIEMDLFPGEIVQANTKGGVSLWRVDEEFDGLIGTAIVDWFSLKAVIHDNKDVAVAVGETLLGDGSRTIVSTTRPDGTPWNLAEERLTAPLKANAFTQLHLDRLTLARSKSYGATSWLPGMDDLHLFVPRSPFSETTWEWGGIANNLLARDKGKVVLLYDDSFQSTVAAPYYPFRGGETVNYVWLVRKGSPLAVPDLVLQLTDPTYDYSSA